MSDLNDLLEAQAALQLKMPNGIDPRDMTEEQKALFIKDMTLALTDELHELLAEVGWKPWASSRHVNVESARGELIDALHFMLNLALALDMDGFQIQEMYFAKHKKNQQRQESGYDGVSEKCCVCNRALDDEDKLLSRGEEGCFDPTDRNSGHCREVGKAIFPPLFQPEKCVNGIKLESVRYNDRCVILQCGELFKHSYYKKVK